VALHPDFIISEKPSGAPLPQEKIMPRELSNLCLGIKSIAKLHLHDSVSYKAVLRAPQRHRGIFVPIRDENAYDERPECGGRVELRGDEYVCLSCGLVDEERSTVEAQAREYRLGD
jgi:hypothetical protein